MNLQGKKILVTGGAGFIGSHIISLLAEEGCAEIVAVDNMIRGRPENLAAVMEKAPIRIVEGDICDRSLMEGLVKDSDLVFHKAA
ncbi:MAG: NAD-dependent epimerase/dehydratase family protein, partial [Nitrospinaceae bacterium]|nr:NAD-dependent epimerase/dehydratase family protein [Nitrospinaceae bacterium]